MKKVLVIDDEVELLEAISFSLSSAGYKVETCEEAASAYVKIENFKPNVILLDFVLNGEDGRKVCLNIKNNTKTKSIPVIMISAHPNFAKEIVDCKSDDFLPKPFDLDTLFSKINKFV